MNRWFRFYDDAVNDPKVQRLSPTLFKAWVNLLCLASKNDGWLPPIEDCAFTLRMKERECGEVVEALIGYGLFEEYDGRFTPHNWKERQYKSDVSTERVKRFRKQQRNVSSAVSETPPDTDTDTDTEQKEDNPSPAAPEAGGRYFFESGVIRLNERDYRRWEKAFPKLDLQAELIGMTEWAGKQSSWFYAVGALLAKRNREIGVRIAQGPPPTQAAVNAGWDPRL